MAFVLPYPCARKNTRPFNIWVLFSLFASLLPFINYSCHEGPHVSSTDPYVIQVTGQRYEWRASHAGKDGVFNTPDDITELQNIYLPSKTKVKIYFKSEDLIYFLEIPALNQTGIAIPDKDYFIEFDTPGAGKYEVKGHQMCGYAHKSLFGTLKVMSSRRFSRYLDYPERG